MFIVFKKSYFFISLTVSILSLSIAHAVAPLKTLEKLNRKVSKELLHLVGVKTKSSKKSTDPHFTQRFSLHGIQPESNTLSSSHELKLPEHKVSFEDVIGLEPIIKEVKQVVDFIKNPEKFRAVGAYVPRGILLEGPPGTGKTLIAKAIAHEAGCNFLYESGSSFVEMYVGVGAKRIRELFQNARSHKPTIIFIDEFDAIGAVSRGVGGNEEYRQTLNELLCQLDGFQSDSSIVVIAATNYAKALAPALTRAGRFDRILKVSLPDTQARKSIILHYKNKLPSTNLSEECLKNLIQKTEGLNGADLKNLVNEAALTAVAQEQTIVSDTHFMIALEKVISARKR